MCFCLDIFFIYCVVFLWFICIFDIIFDMFKGIEEQYWILFFVKEKCFVSWISNVCDWNVGWNCYWGMFIFLWVSDDFEEKVCVGSVEELCKFSGYEGDFFDIY